MGNFNSCIYPNLRTATLLGPDGTIYRINLPIIAAELMLDNPGQLISPADLTRHARRIHAIKAEDQLSPGKLYLLVPGSRVHSKATPSDTALIDSVCKRRGNKRGGSKVSPVSSAEGLELACHRPGRQWKPVLEPISEEPLRYVKYLTRLVKP